MKKRIQIRRRFGIDSLNKIFNLDETCVYFE